MASHLFMSLHGNAVTKDQLGQVFKRAFIEHQAKLSRIAAFARQEDRFDPTAEMAVELARGWAYRIIATKGPAAHIARSDEVTLRQQGLDDEAIATIRACLLEMRDRGDATPSVARLTALLETVGVEPTPGNLAQAEPAYMRALGEASLRASERYEDPLPYEHLVEEAINLANAAPTPREADAPDVDPGPTPPVPPANPAPTTPPSQAGLDDRVSAMGETLIANKAQDAN
jgi:hypothetical protein